MKQNKPHNCFEEINGGMNYPHLNFNTTDSSKASNGSYIFWVMNPELQSKKGEK